MLRSRIKISLHFEFIYGGSAVLGAPSPSTQSFQLMKSIMKFAILVLQCAIVATAANADIPVVQHVVIIMQINRTPDNLFHGLPAQLPGADIANSGLNSKGQTIPLTAVALANTYDLSHRHSAFQDMYDNGRLDGADLLKCKENNGSHCPANPQFKYVNAADVGPTTIMSGHAII